MQVNRDSYIEKLLYDNKLRPQRGRLWGERHTPNRKQVSAGGLGQVTVTQETVSGIVLVANDVEEVAYSQANLYLVHRAGADPDEWRFRLPGVRKGFNYHQTWASQSIKRGTVVALRSGAGKSQGSFAKFTEIAYNEIVAIGRPKGEPGATRMLPAPGWLFLDPIHESGVTDEGLILRPDLHDRVSGKGAQRGVVKALPRGVEYDFEVGDTIAYPYHRAGGATEFCVFADGTRAIPLGDVWWVEEEAAA